MAARRDWTLCTLGSPAEWQQALAAYPGPGPAAGSWTTGPRSAPASRPPRCRCGSCCAAPKRARSRRPVNSTRHAEQCPSISAASACALSQASWRTTRHTKLQAGTSRPERSQMRATRLTWCRWSSATGSVGNRMSMTTTCAPHGHPSPMLCAFTRKRSNADLRRCGYGHGGCGPSQSDRSGKRSMPQRRCVVHPA